MVQFAAKQSPLLVILKPAAKCAGCPQHNLQILRKMPLRNDYPPKDFQTAPAFIRS
jgi:hypothetical protein